MPFADNAIGTVGRIGDGITDDVITRLAKLRALFVIARGTVYALGDRGVDAQEAGRILNVEYVVSGSVHRHDRRLSVRVELAQTQDARIVWTDEIAADAQDPFVVLDGIVDRIVSSIAEEIELAECRRAILKPPNSLGRVGGLPPRPLAHVQVHRSGESSRGGVLPELAHARPDVCARPCGALVHPLPERVSSTSRRIASTKSSSPSNRPARAWAPTIAIPRRTGRWGARCGFVARLAKRWASSSDASS
jgi:TolB-like protein